MNQRVPPHRRTTFNQVRNRSVASFALIAMLALSSCVSTNGNEGSSDNDGGNPSPSAASPSNPGNEPDTPVIASSDTSSTEVGEGLRIDVHSLKRQENKIVILDFSLSNDLGNENIIALKPPRDGEGAGDFQPLSLIDGTNKKKHLPFLYSDGKCYCSDWEDPEIGPGETIRAWVAFPAPPAEVESMTLTSAIAPPIMDIPLTQTKGEGKPASGETEDPKVWDLHSIEDDLKSNTVREETGDEVAVSLSTDILFSVGKSDLTNKADDTLKQVAQEIDASSGDAVQIDGHTDSTGTSSINDPLSLQRAEAVEKSLTNLITRSEVTFEVDGHGSDDPIATNETEEGKKKNRRVTITFSK